MDIENIEEIIKFLTVGLYTDLQNSDKLILGPNITEILKKSPESHLSALQTLFQHLSNSTKAIKSSEIFSTFLENEVYQKALQKLDSQIRNHIKEQIQLKLFSEDLAKKLSGSENSQRLENLQETKENLLSLIRKKELELESDQLELRLLRENEEKEAEKIEKMKEKLEKIEKNWKKEKNLMDILSKQFEKEKNEFEALKLQVGADEEMGCGGRLVKLDMGKNDINKSCRVIRQGSRAKKLCQIKIGIEGLKLARISQSTKRIRNPQRTRTFKENNEKSNMRTRLQMYK